MVSGVPRLARVYRTTEGERMITEAVLPADVAAFAYRPIECVGGPLDGDEAILIGLSLRHEVRGVGGVYVLSVIRDYRYGLPSVALVWSPDA